MSSIGLDRDYRTVIPVPPSNPSATLQSEAHAIAMDSIPESAAIVLRRHPAPALPVGEVRSLLFGSPGAHAPSEDLFLRELRRRPDLVRILESPPRRWAGAGPRSWIVSRTPGDGEGLTLLIGRLRASLRHLGEGLEPGSALALARWERLLREEARLRGVLVRRREARAPAEGS